MQQRLVQRLVGIDQLDVLAHHGDGDFLFRVHQAVDHALPVGEIGRRARAEAETLDDEVVQALLVEAQRNHVDGRCIDGQDDGLLVDIGEQRNLAAGVLVDLVVGAADQDVRLQADGAQLLDRVLGGLGLGLAGRGDVGHQRQVHQQRALVALLHAHLAHGLHEGLGLDVTGGAADLDNRHVIAAGTVTDALLDGVGDVRDDLHGGAEVVAATLLLDDVEVDAAGGEVVGLGHAAVAQEALVVAEVEVGLGAVAGDEDLAVLVGAHGARIHVDVGIHLDHRDLEAAGLEQGGQRGGGDPFAQRGNNTAGNEDVLGHEWSRQQRGSRRGAGVPEGSAAR